MRLCSSGPSLLRRRFVRRKGIFVLGLPRFQRSTGSFETVGPSNSYRPANTTASCRKYFNIGENYHKTCTNPGTLSLKIEPPIISRLILASLSYFGALESVSFWNASLFFSFNDNCSISFGNRTCFMSRSVFPLRTMLARYLRLTLLDMPRKFIA